MSIVDISGMDKAVILSKLYNGSHPLGMGFIHFTPEDMTVEQARELLETQGTYYDYLNGRVMKIELKYDELSTDLYDRDNGNGAVSRILGILEKE